MAWFWRGAQSAFFFYVSCAPCANARFNHRRAKEKARVDKATKAALTRTASRHHNGDMTAMRDIRDDDQDMLAGVGAFTTNIYWKEEMDMGPNFKKGMRPRPRQNQTSGDRKESKKGKGRRKQVSGKKSMQEDSADGPPRNGAETSMDTLRTEGSNNCGIDRPLSAQSGNQPRRYERPDEALWGNPFPEKDWAFYARGRNPSINSLTPPVVSTLPATAEEASWMLQPPPPAKIMNGKGAPVPRASSFGATGKSGMVANISKRSGGTRFSELKRPEKVLIADLGENMSSMTLPPQADRKILRRRLQVDGSEDDSFRPATPEIGHERQDSALSNFESPARNISRLNRPTPIQTSTENDRDAYGYNSTWKFPKHAMAQAAASPAEPMSTVSSTMDGMHYYSEPEPDLSHSYRALARHQPVSRTGTADSEAPFQTPKSKATTSAGSNVSSPQTLSPESSSTSLHMLKDVLVPASIVAPDETVALQESLDVKAALPPMDGITEEDMDVIMPRSSAGPRQVRLGSGTQV